MTVIHKVVPSVYVISVDGDGEVRVNGMSREIFLLAMNTSPEDDYRGFDLVDPTKMRTDVKESDPMCWGDKRVLAILGEIITPEPVSAVTTWRIADA